MGGVVYVLLGGILLGAVAFLIEGILPEKVLPSCSEALAFCSSVFWLYLTLRGLQGAVMYSYAFLWIPAVVYLKSKREVLRGRELPKVNNLRQSVLEEYS